MSGWSTFVVVMALLGIVTMLSAYPIAVALDDRWGGGRGSRKAAGIAAAIFDLGALCMFLAIAGLLIP